MLSGYVRNLSPSNSMVHWPSAATTIDIYVNSTNNQGLSDNFVQSTAANSVNQWNGHSAIQLRKNSTTLTEQNGFNEIYFSNSPEVFNGKGVVGITAVTYKSNSGEIVEADILISDNLVIDSSSTDPFTFSTVINDTKFLGNVLTHELGHLLGLGHSQVLGSTMFYSLTRGQSQIDLDDKAGLYSIYPNGDNTKVSLSGKIIGSAKLAAVFGAHVEAIGVGSGRVEGAAVSELDGKFIIHGLKKDEQYLIYTKPIVNAGLPAKYTAARNNFCESGKSYRGSFFQSCNTSAEGFPQSVKLSSSNTDVGNVTIRCGLDVPNDYILSKNTTPASFNLLDEVFSGVGNTFTGFFSNQELAQTSPADYFRIDLSSHNPESFSLTGDLFVELKVVNQIFNSPFKAKIIVKRYSSTTIVHPKYQEAADGWVVIDSIVRIPISREDLSDNDLEIQIVPESMDFPAFPSGIPYLKDDMFPTSHEFYDALKFYLATVTIVKSSGSGTYTQITSKQDQLSDNTQCPDAINTYSLTNYSVSGASPAAQSRKKDDGFLGCGSIDLDHDSGSGPTGFFIGLCLSFLFCSLSAKLLKRSNVRTIVQDGRS